MRLSPCSSSILCFSLFVAGCGVSTTGGPGPAAPASIDALFGHDVTFVADRAMSSTAMPGLPADPLAESDYTPMPQNKSYPVSFTADGQTVTVTGDKSMVGTWDQKAGNVRRYNLNDGTFAGGRFDVWAAQAEIHGELTIYGSGVPIISSERGTVVE